MIEEVIETLSGVHKKASAFKEKGRCSINELKMFSFVEYLTP